MHKNRKYTLLFIGWMIMVTCLCLVKIPAMESEGLEIPYADKAVHFIFYFVAAILGIFFARERLGSWLSLPKALILVVSGLVLYGILIEVLQLVYATWRSGEVADAIANALGALAGAGIARYGFSGRGQLKWKN